MTDRMQRLSEMMAMTDQWYGRRLLMYACCTILSVVYIDPLGGMLAGLTTFHAESLAIRVLRRVRASTQAGEKPERGDLLLLKASGSLVVASISTGTISLSLLEGPHLHMFPFSYLTCAMLYIAMYEHQVSRYLYARLGLFGVTAIGVAIHDIAVTGAAFDSPLWLQLALICTIMYFLFDCAIGMVRHYNDRLARTRALAEAKDLAEQAIDEKSMMIATMSHELRTPLNGILGMAELISRAELRSEVRGNLDVLRTSARRLNMLLTDILDTEKLMAERMDLIPVEISLEDLANEAIDLHRGSAETKGLRISLQMPEQRPGLLLIDAVRANQCLSNLLSNAIKFTAEGEITVSARYDPWPKPGQVTIVVRDSGIGMSAEHVSRLFKQFSQGDASIARNYGGTGLGLWISRNLARLMGGDLTVASVPGQGSAFTLTLAAPTVDSDQTVLAQALRGLRILNVEDTAVNRHITRMMLAPFEIDLVESETAEEALDHLEGSAFDMILTDGSLPGMTGADMVKLIRSDTSIRADLPIIAVSADTRLADGETCEALGFDAFVPKPIDERTLLAAIRRAATAPKSGIPKQA